ncbi:MAG: response regulator [Bacteroidales bacterium]|nr:response regulator [Bacteroidales bacterium]
MRVLVADDLYANQFLLNSILEELNITNYKNVSNGQQVLDALEKDNYDVVFMDIEMPVMNGIEATQIIKSEPKYNNIRVIALTAHNLEEFEDKFQDVQFDSILEKPYNPKEFLDTLKKLNLM